MAPGAVRDNTQHARHAAAAPTDWRAHPRGRRATNWTRFVVGRTQILTSRAGVVLRAAGSGDGVARLLARGHGSGGGSIGDGVDADLVRKRSARSCCARRTLRLGPMLCRGGRVDDVVLGSQQERASLSNGALRRAPVACALLWRVTALARPATRLLASSLFRATPTKLALQPRAVCAVLVGAPSWC